MTNKLTLAVAAVATLALAVPAYAQSSAQTSSGAVISVQGGGFSSAVDLNDAKTADFKTGFNAGAGLGYQFTPYVGLRGTFDFARSESRGTALPASIVAGTKVNRFFYGAELQLSAPLGGGVSPYLVAGGGAVTTKPDLTSSTSFTKPAGKVGVGVTVNIPNSNASFFVEGSGWFYQFDQYGFDKTQFDITWNAGFSLRFGK